jgi:hypothetical protein
MKKGQITIFIILAVLIVVVIGVVIYMTTFAKEAEFDEEYFNSASIKPEVDSIKEYVFSCMDDVSRAAIDRIGIQGGFHNQPVRAFDVGWTFIPYYYYEGEYLMPTKGQVEEELSAFVNDNMGKCLAANTASRFEMEYERPETRTGILEGEVRFEIDMDYTIKREGRKMVLELAKHPVTHNSSLMDILEVASFITESHKEDAEMICINCLTDMARERDLYVDMLAFPDETTTLVIISENYTAEEPYMFEFLNRYPEGMMDFAI